jgi:translation initiation factor 2D
LSFLIHVEIDAAFRNAFLYAIHDSFETRRGEPNYGIEFPIQQSQFMSNYILPYLPIFSAEDANSLQLKKTSWKNIKKFIKALDKEVLLKSKDRNGGETVILDIDFDDQKFLNFSPYRLPKKQSTTASSGDTLGQNSNSGDDSIGQHIKRLVLLKPNTKIFAIFAPSQADPHAFYLPTELRQIVTQYIEAEDLISAGNKRLVNINPVLADAVFDSSSIDREVLAKGTIPRDALMERATSKGCTPYYAITRNEEARESAKPKSGTPPSIKITLETRSGNKTATRVSGLESYFIRPAPLAEELQKSCASSTSVSQLVGSSPKNPVMEVMVQGPQKDAIIKALEKRGVKKEWIEVLDKTKKKK